MRVSLASALLPLALGACTGSEPPFVAALELEGTLESNTCGAGGFDADDAFDETANLYGYAGDEAAFRWSDADTTLSGSSTEKGVYTFSVTTSAVVLSDATTGAAICTVERRTKLVITVDPAPRAPVDAGVADADVDAGASTATTYEVTGTLTEDLYSSSGSNCAALRGENGGAFDTFPCRVVYDVVGVSE